MTERDFCYWLKGFFELTDSKHLSEKQILMIKEHLKLVFEKQTSTLEDLEQSRNSTCPAAIPDADIVWGDDPRVSPASPSLKAYRKSRRYC